MVLFELPFSENISFLEIHHCTMTKMVFRIELKIITEPMYAKSWCLQDLRCGDQAFGAPEVLNLIPRSMRNFNKKVKQKWIPHQHRISRSQESPQRRKGVETAAKTSLLRRGPAFFPYWARRADDVPHKPQAAILKHFSLCLVIL